MLGQNVACHLGQTEYVVRDKPATQHRRSPGKPRNWSIKRRSKSIRSRFTPWVPWPPRSIQG